ncbi:AMP-binding protein [Euzebya tangerina]|uniref:AMP-binding protein n=1 Tax=Euzebya tangerina TaxID=591198 RepID=UPI00196B35A7|nr:AMP-binding protein [Euzebya tangerina]
MTALSYVSGLSDVPLLFRTIGAELDAAAADSPDNLAVVSRHQGIRWTYAELHAHAEQAARALLDLGVAKGDRVGMWSPNHIEWVVVQYATAKVGAVLVNVNPAYRTHELAYAMGQSGVSVLIAARAFRETDYVSMIADVRGDLPDLGHVVLLGDDDTPGWAEGWSTFTARGDAVDTAALREREATLDPDDAINIQYTSGTTGAPKGATLSHHNILNNGYFVAERMAITAEDVLCLNVPFYHCFGMVMGNLGFLTHRAAVVLPDQTFDPGAALAAIEAEGCTTFYGVPTMFIAVLEHEDLGKTDISTLRTGCMAGSPCPVEVMKATMNVLGMEEVTIAYGMTETSPVSFQSGTDDDIESRVSTVGRIMPFVEVKIIDPHSSQVVPRGEVGELCTRGYSVMLGYWNNDEATAEAIDAARYMHTGDLAVMRDDGYVNITGRIKDMIIRGGENVYPREVEEFLYTHPDISDVQVFGVPDDKYGEAIAAWVVRKEGTDLDYDGLYDFCKGSIATFKIPVHVSFVDEFPMTVTGKIQKFKMRDVMIEELGLEEQVTA